MCLNIKVIKLKDSEVGSESSGGQVEPSHLLIACPLCVLVRMGCIYDSPAPWLAVDANF